MSDKAVIVANKIKAELRDSQGNSFAISDNGRIQVDGAFIRRTEFDEQIVSQKLSGFNIASYIGPSTLRNTVETNGSGATVESETTGEIKVSSGTDGAGSAKIESNERGVYQPGSQGETGLGVRLGSLPTGNQEVIWGYFDDVNGFGWGIDATDLFVWVRRNSTEVYREYRTDWKVRKLDGSEDNGINIDPTQGNIYQTDFVWYGYGPIAWSITQRNLNNTFNGPQPYRKIVDFYSVKDQGGYKGTSINQPNLPLTLEVHNNGTASNLDVFLGGRQASTLGGEGRIPTRQVLTDIEDYTLSAGQGTWEPILAIRKKEFFNGFPNPVNTILRSTQFYADQDTSFRATLSNDVTGNFNNPETWPDGETAIEIAKVTGTLSVNDIGIRVPPYERIFAGGTGQSAIPPQNIDEDVSLPIGRNQILILWARQDSSTASSISIVAKWAEQF